MPANFAEALEAAKLVALETLLRIVRESESETQARLAAAAILRLPIPKPAAAPVAAQPAAQVVSQPATQPQPQAKPKPPAHAPLTPAELVQLRLLNPTAGPRFFDADGPAHWRAYLQSRAATLAVFQAPPTPAASPPPQQRAA